MKRPTLHTPMRSRSPLVIFLIAMLVVAGGGAHASIIFKPGENAKYLAPGEEEINGTAQELYAIAEEAEQAGNAKRALNAYRTIFRKFPKDTKAAPACYRAGQILEKQGDLFKAAGAYKTLVEKYPGSPDFDEAIEAQFRIGEQFLQGKKKKFIGIPVGDNLDRAVDIFAEVVRTAPYGKYTARAQFDIGLARERQGNNDAAVQAYQAVVDKFPKEPVAADAQYQIGFVWFNAARAGTRDAAATRNAETGFQDFLLKYPRSEKSPQARENLKKLTVKHTSDAYSIARYYDAQKQFKAAVIYYTEVVKQEPGSDHGVRSQRRIDQLHAKFGDEVMEPIIAASKARKKSTASRERQSSARGQDPNMRGAAPNDVAPLPPPDNDASLPPPASLMPDTTTAPEPSPSPAAGSSDEPASDQSASPAP